MKKGETFKNFGCTWMIDDIYEVDSAELISLGNLFGLRFKKRFRAHVVEAPEGYQGIMEMDAAL